MKNYQGLIIFINGSINSGKSTVSKLLAEKMKNSAVIEIDRLRGFIDWMPLEQAIPINLQNAISLIKNFIAHGLNVIVPYPLSQENYEYILENIKDINVPFYFFTLNPSLEVVLEKRGARGLSEKERQRIKYHYQIGINNPSFGTIIDNTNQTPEETVDKILEIISKSEIGK